MKRTINSTEKGKDVGISPAEETPIPASQLTMSKESANGFLEHLLRH